MTRLCVFIVLRGHIQLLAKILQPAKCIDKEGNVAWKLAIGQVCPLYKITVRKSDDDNQSSSHRLSALCFGRKEHKQTPWVEFIARKRIEVLKSKIELLYPRWPLQAAVIAGYSQFSRRCNFEYYIRI